MNPAFFALLMSVCTNNVDSAMCRKTFEAETKQEGYWDYGSKFNHYLNETYGKTTTILVGTALVGATQKKARLQFGNDVKFNIDSSINSNAISLTWRFN